MWRSASKRRPFHDARDLVDAVAEDEAAVVDRQGRTFARQELTVEINHTGHVYARFSGRVPESMSRIGNREGTTGDGVRGTGDGTARERESGIEV